jgi:hypothetical protein
MVVFGEDRVLLVEHGLHPGHPLGGRYRLRHANMLRERHRRAFDKKLVVNTEISA